MAQDHAITILPYYRDRSQSTVEHHRTDTNVGELEEEEMKSWGEGAIVSLSISLSHAGGVTDLQIFFFFGLLDGVTWLIGRFKPSSCIQ